MIIPFQILPLISEEQHASPAVAQQEARHELSLTDLRQQVITLRTQVNDRIRRAEAAYSRAQAIITADTPTQTQHEYAASLLEKSRSLRHEAWELSQMLIVAEQKLATELNTHYGSTDK